MKDSSSERYRDEQRNLLSIFKRLVEELPPGHSLPENLADFL